MTNVKDAPNYCEYISPELGHNGCLRSPGHDGPHEGRDIYCNPAWCTHLTDFGADLTPDELYLLSGIEEGEEESDWSRKFYAMREAALESKRIAEAVAANRVFTDAEWARLQTILPLNERDEPGTRERIEMMYLLDPVALKDMRREIARVEASYWGGMSPNTKQILFRILVGLAIGLFFLSQQK